jgi:hypothetical protein
LKKSLALGDEARIVALMDEDVTDETAGSAKAAQPRPLVGLPSSKPSHENSAQAAPSRAP